MTDYDTDDLDSDEVPERGDGLSWAAQHLRAAQLRAQGLGWHRIADALEYQHGTVRNYSQIEGWHELVDYYREDAWRRDIDNLFKFGSLEALEALRYQWQLSEAKLRLIEEKLEEEGLTKKQQQQLTKGLFSTPKAVVYAADRFLHNSGFRKFAEERASKGGGKAAKPATAGDIATLLGLNIDGLTDEDE